MDILKKLSVVVFLALLSSCSTLGEPTRVDREFVGLDDISIMASAGVTVGKSPNSKVYLTYYEYDSLKYDIEHDANKLTLTQRSLDSYSGRPKGATILIPTILSGTFNATSSGNIIVENSTLTDANITSSEDITVENSTLTTANITSSSGAIKLDRLDANNITITTSSGDIYGSIVGNQDDFTIITKSVTGSASPHSGGSGSKKLHAESQNGDIDIGFTP